MRLAIKPGAGVPRDPNFVFRLQRIPPATPAAAMPEPEPEPALTIGAGADMFADATEIPFEEFRDVLADYTYNKTFTVEVDEPNPTASVPAVTSAWWKVTVPAGQIAWLNADTQLSFAGPLLGAVDTGIAVYWGTEIDALTKIASNDNARAGVFYSRVEAVELDGDASGDPDGTTFFVQVDDDEGAFVADYGICYVVRFSLMLFEPAMTTIPDGQHNPEDPPA